MYIVGVWLQHHNHPITLCRAHRPRGQESGKLLESCMWSEPQEMVADRVPQNVTERLSIPTPVLSDLLNAGVAPARHVGFVLGGR